MLFKITQGPAQGSSRNLHKRAPPVRASLAGQRRAACAPANCTAHARCQRSLRGQRWAALRTCTNANCAVRHPPEGSAGQRGLLRPVQACELCQRSPRPAQARAGQCLVAQLAQAQRGVRGHGSAQILGLHGHNNGFQGTPRLQQSSLDVTHGACCGTARPKGKNTHCLLTTAPLGV